MSETIKSNKKSDRKTLELWGTATCEGCAAIPDHSGNHSELGFVCTEECLVSCTHCVERTTTPSGTEKGCGNCVEVTNPSEPQGTPSFLCTDFCTSACLRCISSLQEYYSMQPKAATLNIIDEVTRTYFSHAGCTGCKSDSYREDHRFYCTENCSYCDNCSRKQYNNGPSESELVNIADFSDSVNHPPHYNQHPSGVECIDIVEHMNFNIGSSVKYLWRHGLKPSADSIEDLEKARWYITREIERLKDL